MIQGVENTCDGCPLLTMLEDDLQKLGSIAFEKHEVVAMAGVVAGKLTVAAEINQAAGEVNCRTIKKDLPEMPSPIPPIGHPTRIAYGRSCPAYQLWKSRF